MSTAQDSTVPLTRPVFSPLQPFVASSQNSSTYQSYSSRSSLASPASSAPLPSPSATHSHQQQDFFGSLHQQQHQAQQHTQTSQRHPVFDYAPNRQGAGTTAAETASFLSQTGLLAEAAKRAQMAVVMRDLDGMEL